MAHGKRNLADNPAMQFLSGIGRPAEPEEAAVEPVAEPVKEEAPVEAPAAAPVEEAPAEVPQEPAAEEAPVTEPPKAEEPVADAVKKARKKPGRKSAAEKAQAQAPVHETEALAAYMQAYAASAKRERKSVRTTISLYPTIYNTAMQMVEEGKIKSLNDVINNQLALLFNIEIPK